MDEVRSQRYFFLSQFAQFDNLLKRIAAQISYRNKL